MDVFKMKRFFKTLLIIACVISCMDCTHMKRRVQESIKDAEWIDSEGDFYTRAVGWDYYRLPLIDPFEADNIRVDDWGIQNHILDSISMLYSVDGIKGINVVKPYIFVYCESNNASDEFEQCGLRDNKLILSETCKARFIYIILLKMYYYHLVNAHQGFDLLQMCDTENSKYIVNQFKQVSNLPDRLEMLNSGYVSEFLKSHQIDCIQDEEAKLLSEIEDYENRLNDYL